MLRLFWVGLTVSLISGCTSYGVVENGPRKSNTTGAGYSLKSFQDVWRSGENSVMLAFSGGGTRAAAFSYGVLKEMRDTTVLQEGRKTRVLDTVDSISSVSGGTFTAAYYGLHGDGIFDDFEEVFLRRDVEGELIRQVLNPLHWFRSTGRTELATKYYEKHVFKGATFADMKRKGRPLIIINASDLGYGVRFSFIQEYFDLICSDISSYPVARAVTASSAVPALFNPVVVKNYSECGSEPPEWLTRARKNSVGNPEIDLVVDGLETYFQRDARQYVHFVDGGITDNLGLRAIYEIIEVAGGAKQYIRKAKLQPPRRIVILSVNASTAPETAMDRSTEQPSLAETVNAMSDIQLHRYNVATLELIETSVVRWAKELSTAERQVEPYFIQIDLQDIKQPELRRFLNDVPTSFKLSDEQVDRLIEAGGQLLRENPEFRRLLISVEKGRSVSERAGPFISDASGSLIASGTRP